MSNKMNFLNSLAIIKVYTIKNKMRILKMNKKINEYGLSTFKVILTSLLCLAGLLSIIYVACTTKELFSYFYCIAISVFVTVPLIISVIFRWKMNIFFYILFSFYTFGPLLGAVYSLYYHLSWWDGLLHLLAGTVFAVIGAQLTNILNKNNKTSYVLSAIFGVLLSIGIAVFWEFFEYGCDRIFNSDMQADTIINIISTKINRTDGLVDVYKNITETFVNGQSLGIIGYLDIGLVDTMHDMIVETLGAFIFIVYVLFDRNKHPMISEVKKSINKQNYVKGEC